jgi:hypothetical protein
MNIAALVGASLVRRLLQPQRFRQSSFYKPALWNQARAAVSLNESLGRAPKERRNGA